MNEIHIGKCLKEYAEKHDSNMTELAESLDITRTHLYKIFRSEDVNTSMLKKFGNYYNVPLLELLTDNMEIIQAINSIIIHGNDTFKMKKIQNSSENREELLKEIELLKTIINDKEEIIKLLKKSMG